MPFQRNESGLFLPANKAPHPYKCSYELDQRPDLELVNLFQRMYRAIQDVLGDQAVFNLLSRHAIARELFPDPVQAWTIYLAVLLHGVCDAALTLILHNLGREARILERQAFEYVAKANYFKRHPRMAKRELEAEVFRERFLLDELGYDKRSKRYREARALCNSLAKRRPALATFARKTRKREPPQVADTLGRRSQRRRKLYAYHYRMSSQTMHGSVLGMRDVITDNGVQFDSRLPAPNISLLLMARYVFGLLWILDEVFNLKFSEKLHIFESELKAIENRLFGAMVSPRLLRSRPGHPQTS